MWSRQNQLAWLAVAGSLVLVAWWSLNRVQHEKLFLFPLPFDRAPFAVEIHDATSVARTWTIPALVFLAVATTAVAGHERTSPVAAAIGWVRRLRELLRMHPKLCVVFAVASLADFISTAIYFHWHRIDDELHPGIKLVTYAFGLSLGCLAGKGIQALLALAIGAVFPKMARPILIVLIVAYGAAAVWNLALD